jgi:hypothetical protein
MILPSRFSRIALNASFSFSKDLYLLYDADRVKFFLNFLQIIKSGFNTALEAIFLFNQKS